MKKSVLILITFLFCIYLINAKETIQITGESPHYLISVTHGGVPIGDIEIEMFPDVAPKHCHNFDSLVSIKFYDSTAFHRVIPNFMIQGGDPNSRNKPRDTWGYGDPSQTTVPAEFSSVSHQRGIMSAARLANDINSATSQFFICVAPSTQLDGKYSVYGHVVNGMNVADTIVNEPRDANNNPLLKVEMMIRKIETNVKEDMTNNSNDIVIYPNPASDMMSFHSDNKDILISKIKVYDVTGKTYIEESYNQVKKIDELNVSTSTLNIGVYFVQLTDVIGKNYTMRIVVN